MPEIPKRGITAPETDTGTDLGSENFWANLTPLQAIDVLGRVAAIPGNRSAVAMRNIASDVWAGKKREQLSHPAVLTEMGKVMRITELTPKQRDAAMHTIFTTVMDAPLGTDPSEFEW